MAETAYTQKPTVESWEEFSEDFRYYPAVFLYAQATVDITTDVKTILDKELSFDELKSELLMYFTERKKFTDHAMENMP